MDMLLAIIHSLLAVTGTVFLTLILFAIAKYRATEPGASNFNTSDSSNSEPQSELLKTSKALKSFQVSKSSQVPKPSQILNSNQPTTTVSQNKDKSRSRRARKRKAKTARADPPQPDKKIAVESHATAPLHPLVAAAQHNHTSSQLHRLPKAVLVRLMQLSDPVSVECLRRTSRILLQLFSDARPLQVNKRIYPWPRPHASFLDSSQRKKLLALLARDSYCSNCLAARRTPDWQTRVTLATKRYLHCSGCDLDHPACLFTPEQRINAQHERICIGHERYVRLCEHEKVSWRQIQLLAQDMQEQGKRPDWKLVAQCENQSHIHFCEWGALKGSSGSLPNRNWDGMDTTRHPALFAGYGDNNGGFRILLSWSAHLSLRRPSGVSLTPEFLSDRLSRLRKKAAGFICPELERGQVVESWLFDPNDCGCVEYKGLDQLGIGWGWPRNAKSKKAHRCQGDQALPLHPLIHSQRPEARRSQRKQDQLGDEAEHCASSETSLAKGGFAEGFSQFVAALPCKGGAECLQLEYLSKARLDGKDGHLRHMVSNWYQVLDPQSYRVTQDKDGFGVYWCEDRRCRNYWQYARSRWRPFLEAGDYIRSCPC